MGKRQQQQACTDPLSMLKIETNLYSVMDEHQRAYAKSMRATPVTFCDAKSGTGKTTIAVMVGLEGLSKNECQKLIYVRYVDDRFLKEGFLPGNATPEEKERGLYQPFLDSLTELGISEYQYIQLRNNGHIELITDRAMRGTNIEDAFVIIDEAQNAREIEDMLLCITRVHTSNCRVVIIGHSGQQDNKKHWRSKRLDYNVFQAFAYHMSKKPWAVTCTLINDYRGEISRHADEIWTSLEEI
ncbi:PhoH family protein [Alicyclobacillus pomorum]|uniref:PhoH family protein n=1 Tax=Alicyclobacillus pomorum TaxID=204470 RepID=UPI00146FAFE9|nr:PhoH family protein [Alicyclobacillus pomorum]